MIIVCGNTKKGGVGKSTIATNIAVDLSRRGVKLMVLDLDPENTASTDFLQLRNVSRIDHTVITSANELIGVLEATKHYIIDIGGLESDLTATAIAIADILFIPFRMSSKDLKALGSFIEVLEGIFTDEEYAEMILVPNFVDPRSNTMQIKSDLKELEDAGYKIGSILTNRASYIHAADYGLSVTEYGDLKAAGEIFPLVEICMNKLNMEQ